MLAVSNGRFELRQGGTTVDYRGTPRRINRPESICLRRTYDGGTVVRGQSPPLQVHVDSAVTKGCDMNTGTWPKSR